MSKETLTAILRFLFKIFVRLEFEGTENIPLSGGVLVTTNHLSQLDTPVLMLNPVRPDITALVTDKYKNQLFTRWFAETAHGIWIDRTRADFAAFRTAIEALRSGQAVGIAPEGTRSKTGGLIEGKSGTVLLAIKAGMPIVPVAVTGTQNGFVKIFTLQRPHFKARFGPAYHLPPMDRDNRDAYMQQATDEIMCRIALELPEEYRGVYADHPRLKELLAACPPLQS